LYALVAKEGEIMKNRCSDTKGKRKSSKNKKRKILTLMPSEIIENIENYPILQEEAAKKRYIGSWVEWHSILVNIYNKDNDIVDVVLRGDCSFPLISCVVSLKKYEKLKALKKGVSIKVRGKISKIDQIAIQLDEAKLKIE
jgi:hypothetical protein